MTTDWLQRREMKLYKKNLKEWKQKGKIPEKRKHYINVKKGLEEAGFEFDKELNVTNELNEETIEKMYDVSL